MIKIPRGMCLKNENFVWVNKDKITKILSEKNYCNVSLDDGDSLNVPLSIEDFLFLTNNPQYTFRSEDRKFFCVCENCRSVK